MFYKKCYKKYNPIQNYEVWYLTTERQVIDEYVDLYTMLGNNAYRDEGVQKFTYDTKHHYDSAWITNFVNNACAQNQQWVEIDYYA